MPVLLVALAEWLWGLAVAAFGWLSANLVSGLVVAWISTVQVVKNALLWAYLTLAFSFLSLRFFTFAANVAFAVFVFEFISFSVDLFTKITDLLNDGTSGSVTLHGVTYNILDNFFAVLDVIGFTDAFIIVKPLFLSYVVFVFTYVARKYFIKLLNSSVTIIENTLQSVKPS